MAMLTGTPDPDEDEVIGSINTTPLVDVMLVLLIIFLITIPVVTSSVPVDLPREQIEPRESRPDHVILSIDAKGQMFWFDTPLRDTGELVQRLKVLAQQTPRPEVQIRGDQHARFEAVGQALQAVQQAGLSRVSFITDPEAP